MLGNFEEDARRVLVCAKSEMKSLRHPYVSSEHLMLAILKNDRDFKFKKYNLDYDVFKSEVVKILGVGKKENEWFLYTPLLKRILENAVIDAKENNNGTVTVNHLLSGLLEEGEGVAIRILMGMGIDIDDLYNDFAYKLVKSGSNFKLLVDELGVDLNKKALNGEVDPVTGRDNEIKRVCEILTRRCKNNPVLIGDAGVGKTAIVEALASKIVSGDVPLSLKGKRIISLDMATMVSGTKYRGEFEERVNKILKEVSDNQDIILFIDEIHTLVGAGGAEGAIDASNIFKPALARGKIRCIGATTTDEYKRFIEKDSALERRFQTVLVNEPDDDVLLDILKNLKGIYENFHNVSISDDILKMIINLSNKYIYNRCQPDKSIDILDEVCARTSLLENKNMKQYRAYTGRLKDVLELKKKAILENDFDTASGFKNMESKLMNDINNLELSFYKKERKIVTLKDVAGVFNDKTGIPIYELLNEKKSIIKQTESILKKKIVGQDEAVRVLSDVYKKIKLGFHEGCFSLLFCGPSGVGKTALAKVFGENLVGLNNIIKLDMSEYKEAHSVSKIIGAPPGYVGYEDVSNVLEKIKNKPYSVLILDEIEKAHSDVINLFLQVLDEGVMKDSRGCLVRFDNVVIIMTSNVGFHDVSVGFNNSTSSKLKDSFSIPFMNRVDKTVIFNNLSKDDILKIIDFKINDLILKYKDKASIKVSKDVNLEILKLSDYETYGARKIDKVIKEEVEMQVIDNLIGDNYDIMISGLRVRV